MEAFKRMVSYQNVPRERLDQLKRELAEDSTRMEALLALREYPEAEDFVRRRIEVENSPGVVMKLTFQAHLPQSHAELNRRLVRFLSDPDPGVRKGALLFVGSNSGRAPMWQVRFSVEVFEKVLALTKSLDSRERASAACALTDIRATDPGRVREAFLRLATDESADVRWRVPHGLEGQYDRPEVVQTVKGLVRDESAVVRYFAILALGPADWGRRAAGGRACSSRSAPCRW